MQQYLNKLLLLAVVDVINNNTVMIIWDQIKMD